MFLHFLEHPNGRFRSPGNTNQIRELIELRLIRPDDPEAWRYNISHQGELMVVAPLVNSSRMKAHVRGHLVNVGLKVDDRPAFHGLLQHIATTGRLP